ncbi:hypothetical protein [Nesterenkonia sp. NBAIMH1]|uniref:hypothetical protein n=1 Tax=Nesterenkonia sp. NBAIMH1 TaxID=2600320 RepID=UPI0011B79D1F|nr:hypothetical protein [Nesterenkonia sp. NBAIMH1]
MNTITLQPIQAVARWLLEAHEPMAELRYKGTPRPWKQPDPTVEQRAEQDAEARADRRDRQPGSTGVLPPAPAPVHLDVLDDLEGQQQTAHKVARRIAKSLQHDRWRVLLARDPSMPTRELLRYISNTAVELDAAGHPETLEATAATLQQMKAATARHLTEVTEGQRRKTECPWCRGEHLKIRTIGPDDRPEVVVRCESQQCEPSAADCGTWHRGMPCWPFHEWEWLAKRIDGVNSDYK